MVGDIAEFCTRRRAQGKPGWLQVYKAGGVSSAGVGAHGSAAGISRILEPEIHLGAKGPPKLYYRLSAFWQ